MAIRREQFSPGEDEVSPDSAPVYDFSSKDRPRKPEQPKYLETKDFEAQKMRAERLRNNPHFRALAQFLKADIPLLNEYLAVVERGSEFKAKTTTPRTPEDRLNKTGDFHRDFAPMLAALANSERGRFLLELAMDRSMTDETKWLKEQIESGDNYVDTFVIGSGPAGQAFNNEYSMYFPEAPALTIDDKQRAGGTFALGDLEFPSKAVWYLNSRTRPENSNLPNLPGTEASLNTLGQHAVAHQADIGNTSYGDQRSIATPNRENLWLNARVMLGSKVEKVTLNPNYPNTPGVYRISMRDEATQKTYEVNTDSSFGMQGLQEDVINLDFNDTETKRIYEQENQIYKIGGDARVTTFSQEINRLGDPSEPFPLRGRKKVILSGNGDGGNIIAEFLTMHGPGTAKSVAQLDWPEEIIWIGQELLTKEKFIECVRTRYHEVGLELPRDVEDYYYRIKPISGARTKRLKESNDGVGIVVEYVEKDENGKSIPVVDDQGQPKTEVFYGDHAIISHGFRDRTAEVYGELYKDIETDPENIKARANEALQTVGTISYFVDKMTGEEKTFEVRNVARETKANGNDVRVIFYRVTGEGLQRRELTPGNLKTLLRKYINPSTVKKLQIGRGETPEFEDFFDPDISTEVPIGKRLKPFKGREFDIYAGGAAAKLKPTPAELKSSPAVESIPENTASLFLNVYKVELLAEYWAKKKIKLGKKTEGLTAKKRPAPEIKTPISGQRASNRLVDITSPRATSERGLPYDANLDDILKMEIAADLFSFDFPDSLKLISFDIERKNDESTADTIAYSVIFKPPLPREYSDITDKLLVEDSLIQKVIARLTKKELNPRENIVLNIPFANGQPDIANINYTKPPPTRSPSRKGNFSTENKPRTPDKKRNF